MNNRVNCRIIVVENATETVQMLKSFGYEKRSGSPSYKRTSICIVPKKKWFWESNELVGTYIEQL